MIKQEKVSYNFIHQYRTFLIIYSKIVKAQSCTFIITRDVIRQQTESTPNGFIINQEYT